jgi:hypothetical protein
VAPRLRYLNLSSKLLRWNTASTANVKKKGGANPHFFYL